jgi:Heterokaryon incompatibility protein (HET)
MAGRRYGHSDGTPDIDLFVYSPQEHSDSLRLIKITDPEALECEIHHHGIKSESLPKYSALSYVWGAPIDRVPITCNGKQLFITRTLQNALRHVAPRNPFSFFFGLTKFASTSSTMRKGLSKSRSWE